MIIDYRVLTMKFAVDAGVQGVNTTGWGWESDVGIWRCENGQPVELIASDSVGDNGDLVEAGGYDWGWWAERLNDALLLGLGEERRDPHPNKVHAPMWDQANDEDRCGWCGIGPSNGRCGCTNTRWQVPPARKGR